MLTSLLPLLTLLIVVASGQNDNTTAPSPSDNTTAPSPSGNTTAPTPSDNTTAPTPASNCNLPANCKTGDCWSATDIQCTECNRGYFINSTDLQCLPCSSCDSNHYISWPCEGYTDTVCSLCYSDACHPCQVGYTLDLYGLCVGQLCSLYGCGASLIDVLCTEYDSGHFLCVCPGEIVSVVAINDTFAGCSGSTPATSDEIVANVNATSLEAHLINGIEQVLGAAVVTVNGSSFTLNVNATVPIDGITAELQREIASYLGGDITAEDVTVQYTGQKKKRDAYNGQVQVDVTTSAANSIVMVTPYLILGLLSVLLTLF